jgi:uncharacterized protein HemX
MEPIYKYETMDKIDLSRQRDKEKRPCKGYEAFFKILHKIGGYAMIQITNKRALLVILVLFIFGITVAGCAATSQKQVLEEKVDRALENAEKALKEAETAKTDSEKCCTQSAKNARMAEDEASRAERAAERAEEAARNAERSAERAEKTMKKCEDIFDRIMAK